MITFLLLLSLFYLEFQTKSQIANLPVSSFKSAVEVGSVLDSTLAEVSGIIASKIDRDYFWVINDSGNDPKLYLINKSGETVHYYWIEGIENRDWEDLATYTDKVTGKRKLCIGDIGDNYAMRDHIQVIVIDEPTVLDPADTIISDYQNYLFRYEDGARDAETIIVDPSDSKILIISKREEQARIYEAPERLSAADTMRLTYKSNLPIHNVTSGDISLDGNEILIKSYTQILYWKKENNSTIFDAMNSDFELLRYDPEPQGESICWAINGKGFYTLSEKSWSAEQVLYYFERNIP